MKPIFDRLHALMRPRLLVRAARFGLQDYRRDRDLRRILKTSTLPGAARALEKLLDEEEKVERARLDGDANYSAARHVELIIALSAEAKTLRDAMPVVLPAAE